MLYSQSRSMGFWCCAGKVLGMPAAKVKQYVQATRDQKSLDAPLFKSNDKGRNNGESLVDTIAADDSDDEEAVEHARCAVLSVQQSPCMSCKQVLEQDVAGTCHAAAFQ